MLRAAAKVPAGDAYACIGISRQRARYYRIKHSFPQSDAKGMIDTSAIAAWLAAKGTRTVWM
jgi:hypothetical protein